MIQAKMKTILQQLMMMKTTKVGGTGDLIFNKTLLIQFWTMKTKIAMHRKKEPQINLNH